MSRPARGFALLVLLLLVSLTALYLVLGPAVSPLRQRLAQGDRVQRSLALAKAALIGYAATYRDHHENEVPGYLPCPDLNNDGTAEGTCGKQGEAAVGLLPYKTLGLPEPLDEAGGRLWYVVAGGFKNNPPVTPLNWDSQGAIAIGASAGNALLPPLAAPDDANGGVAAVVLALGERWPAPAAGGNNTSCGALAGFRRLCTIDGNVLQLRPEAGATSADPPRLLRLLSLSPREIFAPITRRADFSNAADASPPGQLNVLIDMAQKVAATQIGKDLTLIKAASGTPASALPDRIGAYPQFSGKLIGEPAATMTMTDKTYVAYWNNWRDQFRYVVCADLRPATPCMNIGGQDCRGALVFAGRAANGMPRPGQHKPPASATDRGIYLPFYFEADDALPLLNGPTMRHTGAERYTTASASADIVRCLVPGRFMSFAKDIGGFVARNTSSSKPEAAIDAGAASITLGNTDATTSGSGCVWQPTPLPFRSHLRAYFKFSIQKAGEGFVFAVADAATNHPSGALCGDSDGAHLGYAGPGIVAPKFGVEIDTHGSSASNDPGSHHIAFVYWGKADNSGDDNTHNAGTAGTPESGAEPLNPRDLNAKPPGIANVKSSNTHLSYAGTLPLKIDIHVRLDAFKRREPTPAPNRLTLRAYVATVFGAAAAGTSYTPTCESDDFRNLALDLDALCQQNTTIEQIDVPLDDFASGEALAQVIVGFTNGQGSVTAARQSITVSDFLVYSQ